MPQPKSTAGSAAAKRRTTAAKPSATAAKKPAARTATSAAKTTAAAKPTARKTAAAAKKPAASRTSAASKAGTTAAAKKPASRTSAASKAGASKPAARSARARGASAAAKKPAAPRRATGSKPAAAKPAASAAAKKPPRAAKPADPFAQLAGALREQLSDRVFEPMNLVMIAAERIQEAVDEAVERGRMTRGDANDLSRDLLNRGRKQTDDVLGNLDELLGKGLDQLATISRKLEGKTSRARRADSVDRLMRSADRARRAVGVGPSFPILGYDDLSAAKIAERVGDLKPAELRKVRDYEKRHANRKSVLAALEKALK